MVLSTHALRPAASKAARSGEPIGSPVMPMMIWSRKPSCRSLRQHSTPSKRGIWLSRRTRLKGGSPHASRSLTMSSASCPSDATRYSTPSRAKRRADMVSCSIMSSSTCRQRTRRSRLLTAAAGAPSPPAQAACAAAPPPGASPGRGGLRSTSEHTSLRPSSCSPPELRLYPPALVDLSKSPSAVGADPPPPPGFPDALRLSVRDLVAAIPPLARPSAWEATDSKNSLDIRRLL
mmetsp:Transcript_22067/g.68764  ORF Transcript_22067/g.68764 Transcript_22067/m.68764 type:complete len:234 (-) Transcript_22067:184-885(-)